MIFANVLRVWCGAGLVALALAGEAPAQGDPTAAARQAASDLNGAIAALEAAGGAQNRVAALTKAIRAHEDGLSGLRNSLREVTIREQTLQRRFSADRDRIARLLGVMTGIGRTSGPQLLLHPSGPLGTARAGSILAELTPALQAEADVLGAQLADIKALRAVQLGAVETLEQGLRSVQAARVALSQAVSDRRDLPHRLTETPEALATLVQSVETLAAFADLLGDTRLAPDAAMRSFSAAKGTLPLPVQGRILRRFDSPDAAGINRPGLVIATEPRALVTTPWAATIRYMGPLLDYGNVMVIEPEDGYLLVMTGLGDMYGEVGQVLPSGAPIGLMGGNEPDLAPLMLAGQDVGGVTLSESLYIELREGNTPTDPEAWFEQTTE